MSLMINALCVLIAACLACIYSVSAVAALLNVDKPKKIAGFHAAGQRAPLLISVIKTLELVGELCSQEG